MRRTACTITIPSRGDAISLDRRLGAIMTSSQGTDTQFMVRAQSAGLQEQVDGLREIIARQDTVIHQLALAAGTAIKPE